MWADKGGHDFEQAPVGTELARCIKVIDLGTQQSEYQGKTNHKRQALIMWELPNALMNEGDYAGQPFVVSKFYTASLNEKANLRADLVSWRGREFTEQELAGFDPRKILGVPCMLSLVANEKGKTRVASVMAAPRGMPIPDQINPSLYFSMWPGNETPSVFDHISKGVQDIIKKSPEWAELQHHSLPPPEFDDDIDEDIAF